MSKATKRLITTIFLLTKVSVEYIFFKYCKITMFNIFTTTLHFVIVVSIFFALSLKLLL